MVNTNNTSGADTVSGSNINSGSKVIENSYFLGVTGEIDIIAKTNNGLRIHVPASEVIITGSRAKVYWAEKKD